MRILPEQSYEEWETQVPRHLREDPLWSLRVYRTALFAGELGRRDSSFLAEQASMSGLADQLFRATGSISANISEGYSRIAPRDRGRFWEYALGSARESRDWYYKAREELGPDLTEARLILLTGICRVLTKLISNLRPHRR